MHWIYAIASAMAAKRARSVSEFISFLSNRELYGLRLYDLIREGGFLIFVSYKVYIKCDGFIIEKLSISYEK